MADYAAPEGPPPPKVPAGWKAQWNDQYKEWFYVNIYTKKSQWDKPTEPVYPPVDDNAPPGPPPGYSGSGSDFPRDSKPNPYDTQHSGGSSSHIDDDAALAARLQAEEDARVSGNRNAMQDYASTPVPNYQSTSPAPQEKSKGFLGKLLGKHSSSRPPQQYYPQQQSYGGGYSGGYGGQPGYGQPQGGYYPQQGYPQGQYGGYGGGYGGGYQQQQRPQKSGMGTGGALALGAAGGLVGGMLLEDAIDDHDQEEYQQGYDAGQDDGGDMGDMGGDF